MVTFKGNNEVYGCDLFLRKPTEFYNDTFPSKFIRPHDLSDQDYMYHSKEIF